MKQQYKDCSEGIGAINIEEAINRFNVELDSNFSNLEDETIRTALTAKWSGYVI